MPTRAYTDTCAQRDPTLQASVAYENTHAWTLLLWNNHWRISAFEATAYRRVLTILGEQSTVPTTLFYQSRYNHYNYTSSLYHTKMKLRYTWPCHDGRQDKPVYHILDAGIHGVNETKMSLDGRSTQTLIEKASVTGFYLRPSAVRKKSVIGECDNYCRQYSLYSTLIINSIHVSVHLMS